MRGTRGDRAVAHPIPEDMSMTVADRLPGLDAISGRVLWPSSEGYEEARVTFNGTIDRRPTVIVQCQTVDDVVAAVGAARAAGLPIAVRGGGHSVAGHAIADDALVVDLREMRAVRVDPERRLAFAQGGANWEDFDAATIPFGLATTGGTVIDTGIGGLTLSGGIGFIMGTAGLTCDTLVGATVVTADGSIVDAGSDEHRDLLWALRGGGGNFGIVTEFVYALQPIGPMQVGEIVAPLSESRALLATAAEYARTAPREVSIFVLGPTTEGGEDTPSDPTAAAAADWIMRIGLVYQGTTEEAEAAIAPLRSIPGSRGGMAPASYTEIQASSGTMPFGLRHYWKGHFLRDFDANAIEATVEALNTIPGGMTFLLAEAMTGQARIEPDGGAAFGQREARWNVSAIGIWEDPAQDAQQIAWVRHVTDALSPSSLTGAGYGNYANEETPDRVRAAFGDERFERLRRIKRRYDPDNAFRFNHNIPPADA
jgi:FAD/FMN-containing dehydrogenase